MGQHNTTRRIAFVFLGVIGLIILMCLLIVVIGDFIQALNCPTGSVAVRGYWGWPVCVRAG